MVSNVDVKIEEYEKRLVEQLGEYTYGEALTELRALQSDLIGSWDDIIESDGKYVLYDYKRNHRGDRVGDEVSEDVYAKNMALIKVMDDVRSGKVQVKEVEDTGLTW